MLWHWNWWKWSWVWRYWADDGSRGAPQMHYPSIQCCIVPPKLNWKHNRQCLAIGPLCFTLTRRKVVEYLQAASIEYAMIQRSRISLARLTQQLLVVLLVGTALRGPWQQFQSRRAQTRAAPREPVRASRGWPWGWQGSGGSDRAREAPWSRTPVLPQWPGQPAPCLSRSTQCQPPSLVSAGPTPTGGLRRRSPGVVGGPRVAAGSESGWRPTGAGMLGDSSCAQTRGPAEAPRLRWARAGDSRSAGRSPARVSPLRLLGLHKKQLRKSYIHSMKWLQFVMHSGNGSGLRSNMWCSVVAFSNALCKRSLH